VGGSRSEDSKLSAGGGGDKGKRRGDIDVEAEQSKLVEERNKRKSRANEGDDRFNKKTKNEEAHESKKFDVSEDDLGTFHTTHPSEVSMLSVQNDIAVKGVGRTIQWQIMLTLKISPRSRIL